jgi:hypothetical protein
LGAEADNSGGFENAPMTNLRSNFIAGRDLAGALAFHEQEVLERAVAKVVYLGESVGVDTDQMIEMLDHGMTVRELLEYLASLTE